MSAASDLLGDATTIRQILLWQVLGQVLAPILEPITREIANVINTDSPEAPMSPADAADAVVRGELSAQDGASVAAMNGVSADTFARMVAITGEPPAVQELLFLFRRQLIDEARLVHGIRQSRVKDEWIDAIRMLQTQPISPADAVAAAVENQLSHDEAARIAFEGGIDRAGFDVLVNTRGRPPGPAELLELVRRGFIPATGTGPGVLSLDQGISESDVKDKWIPAYHRLLEYMPPPRTVTALLRAGSIDQATAHQLFQDAGLTPALASAYVADASHQKLAAHKDLAKSDVLALYHVQAISAADVHTMVEALGYTAAEVDLLLQLEDLKRVLRMVNAAISRVHSQFVAHRLDRATAVTVLDELRVPAAQRDQLLADWDLERQANVKVPATGTICQAFYYGIIDQATATAELVRQGYSAFDAWLELSVHAKTALPGQPAVTWPEPGS